MFGRVLLFISIPILVLMCIHGADGFGYDIPAFMLEPIFATAVICSGVFLLVFSFVPVIPFWIILIALLMVWVVGFGYVYANYVIEIICIQPKMIPSFLQSVFF